MPYAPEASFNILLGCIATLWLTNAQDGAAAIQKLDELQEVTKKQSEEIQKLVSSFNSERVLRKKYHNMIEDMKGKIRVYCRVRPLSSSEKERVS